MFQYPLNRVVSCHQSDFVRTCTLHPVSVPSKSGRKLPRTSTAICNRTWSAFQYPLNRVVSCHELSQAGFALLVGGQFQYPLNRVVSCHLFVAEGSHLSL